MDVQEMFSGAWTELKGRIGGLLWKVSWTSRYQNSGEL